MEMIRGIWEIKTNSIEVFIQVFEMMFKRTRWTPQEVQQLQKIYSEEQLKGKKRLWVRITDRINSHVRPAKRQAIEYKWKNFSSSEIKLCREEQLIELLFELIPQKGYKELTLHQAFKGITQSNIKNIFYSNIRSISNFISSYLQVKESMKQIVSMLKNRQFLLFVSQQSINFIHFRRKINSLKRRLVGLKRQELLNQEQQISKQKQQIIIQYSQIRRLYTSNQLQFNQKMAKPKVEHQNISKQLNSLNVKNSKLLLMSFFNQNSMQFLQVQALPTAQIKQNAQQGKRQCEFQDQFHNIYSNKLNETNLSSNWLCNDF